MSAAISNLIRKYKDKKYFDFCLLLSFLSAWLFVVLSGYTELESLFSNNHLGLFEALFFTQIDLLSFERSGIVILSNNSWRSVTDDTFLASFQYWYNAIYLALWFVLLRFLVSKEFNTLVSDIDLTNLRRQSLQFLAKLGAAFKNILKNLMVLLKKWFDESERKRTSTSKYKYEGSDTPEDSSNHLEPLMDGSKLDMEAQEIHSRTENEPQHKDCPFCCEEVLYRAIKCKHCGSELEPMPEPEKESLNKKGFSSKRGNDEITWKHYVGIFFIVIVLFSMFSEGEQSSKPDKESAKSLCRSYIAKIMGRHISIVRTKHIKYDGGHFVKAYYNRTSDGDYFEFVCSLDNNNIVWAGVFNGNELGRWRYEDEMKYKRNKDGSWKLY